VLGYASGHNIWGYVNGEYLSVLLEIVSTMYSM
jgi:hypothetical protein